MKLSYLIFLNCSISAAEGAKSDVCNLPVQTASMHLNTLVAAETLPTT
ncbi:hypothetical protein H6G89_19495 [Oscillatoria sp. FACHB-1407]|nr:hypothetical protein [Oscillatoria sp. FACHB-1407]MBD2463222.1 hypothetical protein [Oscillatoria sp. FACHB-1407]